MLFFDYKYVASTKNEDKGWNNRFTYCIPFLCGLTSALVTLLQGLCCLESSQFLLFRKSNEDILQAYLMLHIVAMFLCLS